MVTVSKMFGLELLYKGLTRDTIVIMNAIEDIFWFARWFCQVCADETEWIKFCTVALGVEAENSVILSQTITDGDHVLIREAIEADIDMH